MRESAGDGDLAQEAARSERDSEIRAEDFQGDWPVVPPVLGQIHGRPATATELALDRVAVAEGVSECRGRHVGHGRPMEEVLQMCGRHAASASSGRDRHCYGPNTG